MGCLATGLLLFTGTRGGLADFSPHTLKYQFRSEFTVCFGEWPVYRSAPHESENALVAFLVQERFVTPVEAQADRWEPIFHWNNAWRDGYGPLYDVFIRHRQEIIDWSKADRERARIYWSEGFKHLRSHRETDLWTGREILLRGWRCQSIPELTECIAVVKKDVSALFD